MQRINKEDGKFNCEGCKKSHSVSAWAAAHMGEYIGFKCPDCGTEHRLKNWIVTKLLEDTK